MADDLRGAGSATADAYDIGAKGWRVRLLGFTAGGQYVDVLVDDDGKLQVAGSSAADTWGADTTAATGISSATTWTKVFDISDAGITTLTSLTIAYTGDYPIVLTSAGSGAATGDDTDEEFLVPPFFAGEWVVSTTNDIYARQEGTTPTRGSLYLSGAGT